MEDEQYNEKRKTKRIKVLIWSLAGIVILIIASIAGSWYLQMTIPDKLKDAVSKESMGQYQLEFDQMTVSLLNGNVKLQNVSLNIDTQAYFQNNHEGSADYLLEMKADEINISRMNVVRYFLNKKLTINGLFIDRPNIVLYQMRDTLKVDSSHKSLYEKLPEILKGAKLSRLKVNELVYSKRRVRHLSDSVNTLSGLSFTVDDIFIEPSAIQDSSRVWFSKDIRIHSQGLTYTLANGLYFLKIEKLNVSTKNKNIHAEAFKVIPLYKEIEFSHKLGKQGDRYNILVPHIKIADVNFKMLEQEQRFITRSIILENGQALIFNNKKLPSDGKNVIRNAPHLALQRLTFPIIVDSLSLKNFEVHYKELSPESNEVGDAFFTNLSGLMKNVTNDSTALKTNHWLTSSFTMNFLDNAQINVDLNLNLSSPVGEFNYKGSLGPASAMSYNKLLEPIAMVKAERGFFNKISFDVKANQKGSHGTVRVLYKDLKVSVLVRENSGRIGRAGLESFIANRFIIRPNNPEAGEAVRVANFTHSHPPTRSFFNLMWKSIFTGIKETVVDSNPKKKKRKK